MGRRGCPQHSVGKLKKSHAFSIFRRNRRKNHHIFIHNFPELCRLLPCVTAAVVPDYCWNNFLGNFSGRFFSVYAMETMGSFPFAFCLRLRFFTAANLVLFLPKNRSQNWSASSSVIYASTFIALSVPFIFPSTSNNSILSPLSYRSYILMWRL